MMMENGLFAMMMWIEAGAKLEVDSPAFG